MEVIRGYGYYSTTRARFKRKFTVKSNTWFYLTASLWSFNIQGGSWFWTYILEGFRIPFTLIVVLIDMLRIAVTWSVIAFYKTFVFLMKWIFDLLKSIIVSAFNTVAGKFIGVLLIIGALVTAYILLFDMDVYSQMKEFFNGVK